MSLVHSRPSTDCPPKLIELALVAAVLLFRDMTDCRPCRLNFKHVGERGRESRINSALKFFGM